MAWFAESEGWGDMAVTGVEKASKPCPMVELLRVDQQLNTIMGEVHIYSYYRLN